MGQSSALSMKQTTTFQNSKRECHLSISRRTRYLQSLNTFTYVIYTLHFLFFPFFQRVLKHSPNHCFFFFL